MVKNVERRGKRTALASLKGAAAFEKDKKMWTYS